MRYPLWMVLAASCLCSCTDVPAQAEKRLEMVERVGTLGEVCEAATAVADAYLHEEDEENYRHWHMMASAKCLSAELQGRDLPAQEDEGADGEAAHTADAIGTMR